MSTAITPTQAQQWAADPETAPQWLMRLLGERMAAAAQAEYWRQQEAEQHERRALAAEQSALARVNWEAAVQRRRVGMGAGLGIPCG